MPLFAICRLRDATLEELLLMPLMLSMRDIDAAAFYVAPLFRCYYDDATFISLRCNTATHIICQRAMMRRYAMLLSFRR